MARSTANLARYDAVSEAKLRIAEALEAVALLPDCAIEAARAAATPANVRAEAS